MLTDSAVVIRFLLGASEGSVYNGIMIHLQMFYTRREIGQRVGWAIQCHGLATILTSFLAFAAAHLRPDAKVAPWQLLMLICSALTFVIAILFLILFPDNPVKARLLTNAEKVNAVRRIRQNQTGIETKVWKYGQFIDALKDVKTWLFFLLAMSM